MKYLMKIKGKDWKAFKEKSKEEGTIGFSMRLNIWIEHFALYGFVGEIGKTLLDGESGGKYTRSSFDNQYSIFQIQINSKPAWGRFKEKCSNKNVSANYMLNRMVLHYIENGAFVEKNIKA